jgi:hypothetical protein
MRDGSGNPFMERSVIKDYNVQPDPAGKEWKLGHAQNKHKKKPTCRCKSVVMNKEDSFYFVGCFSNISNSKIKVALGGITPPAPLSP